MVQPRSRFKKEEKYTLDVETLTTDHDDAFKVHAVQLIGANGKQDHAVAVVNGMIFDSSHTHAMLLCQKALDWCCNCNGGFGKTGQTLRIKITRCMFEAANQVQFSAPTSEDDWIVNHDGSMISNLRVSAPTNGDTLS